MRLVQHRSKQRRHSRKKMWALLFIVVLIIGGGWYVHTKDNGGVLAPFESKDKSTNTVKSQTKSNTLRTFTSQEFHTIYENMLPAYPNTQLITDPPKITGNTAADKRIRALAEKRGYELRAVPVYPIEKTSEITGGIDNLLQQRAYTDWKKLLAAAKKDAIPLKLNSGYRSVAWQRQFFVEKLRAKGLTDAMIASGASDVAIEQVMDRVAPPGYSRHHTGYTVDLWCLDGSLEFEDSKCFTWLKADNYKVAKNTGWIPSYPDGAKNQGPEPESWEYVWVGRDQLTE